MVQRDARWRTLPAAFVRPLGWAITAAAAWVLLNSAYVYFVAGSGKVYRIEDSAYIFVLLTIPFVLVARARDRFPDSQSPRFVSAAIVVAVAVWLALLLPMAAAPFMSDDYVFLDAYGRSLNLAYQWEFFRPLFAAVFSLLARAWHARPLAFHVAGFALHLGISALVYVLTLRVSGSRLQATIAFVVFLLNPIQLEATLWISGLHELLWSFFALLAVVIHIYERELSFGRIGAVAVCAAAALLSKETAVSFILLILVFDVALFKMDRGRLLFLSYGIYVLVLVGYLYLRYRM